MKWAGEEGREGMRALSKDALTKPQGKTTDNRSTTKPQHDHRRR